MRNPNFGLEIIAGNQPLAEYTHREGEPSAFTNTPTYVVGQLGTFFALRLINTSQDRAIAVLSVEGINPITGELSIPSSPGYIIPAHHEGYVHGRQVSVEEVSRFYFTRPNFGYKPLVTSTGDDVNKRARTISVTFFRERTYEEKPAAEKEDDVVLGRYPDDAQVSVGYDIRYAQTVEPVQFVRQPKVASRFEIRFRTEEELRALGVDVHGMFTPVVEVFQTDLPADTTFPQ